MKRALLVAAFFLAAAGPAWPQAAGGVENPAWIGQPDPAAFRANYPDEAVTQQVEGQATIECLVRLDTTLTCTAINEAPLGWGFGAAAIEIAKTFRVRPARRNGRDIEGGRVRRTIHFHQPLTDDASADNMPEDVRQALALTPPPELPVWDDAPTHAQMREAYPAEALRTLTEGRVTFSCTVREDRRLNCQAILERPNGNGFGEAAASVIERFRVSTNSADFIARHRTEPFLLPVSFSDYEGIMPVNRIFTGLQPLTAPAMRLPRELSPPNVPSGSVTMLCTFTSTPSPQCAVEQETHPDLGLGQVLAQALPSLNLGPGYGFVAGDQLRFSVVYGPET